PDDLFCRRIGGPSFFLQNWLIVHGQVCEIAGNRRLGGRSWRAKVRGVLFSGLGFWSLGVSRQLSVGGSSFAMAGGGNAATQAARLWCGSRRVHMAARS